MDAVEFLKARRRLCNNNICEDSCPLFHCEDDDTDDDCVKQVCAVEQWAKEHPIKTMQDKLLDVFPKSKIINGCVLLCPMNIDEEYQERSPCSYKFCEDCRRDFWLKEID